MSDQQAGVPAVSCGWCRDPYCAGDHSGDAETELRAGVPAVPGLIGHWDHGACDAAEWGAHPSMLDGRCRCIVCAYCGHHTGNANQGHHWTWCAVTQSRRAPHFCCPDPVFGCELERSPEAAESHGAGTGSLDTAQALPSAPEPRRDRTGASSPEPGGWRQRITDALDSSTDPEQQVGAVLAAIEPLAELESAIDWGTSCLSCAAVLDSCAAETFRRETAEAKLAAVAAYVRDRQGDAGLSLLHAGDLLAITGEGPDHA